MPDELDRLNLPEPDPEWFRRPNGYDASASIHGLGHTRRVLVHAAELADAVGISPWEAEALTLAALWHDIGRTNDGADYYHGAKSAGKAVALGLHLGVEPMIYETSLYAITHHCGNEQHGERAASYLGFYESDAQGEYRWTRIERDAALRVFRLLKDADGLDRVRLGDLDPSYLRYPESQARLARAWQLLVRMP